MLMAGHCDLQVHNLSYLVLVTQSVAAFSTVMDQEMCGKGAILRYLWQVRPVIYRDQKAGIHVR